MPAVLEKTTYSSPDAVQAERLPPMGKMPREAELDPFDTWTDSPRAQELFITVKSPQVSSVYAVPPGNDEQDGSPRDVEQGEIDSNSQEAVPQEFKSPVWLQPVIDQLVELLALPANWDHHGAQTIDEQHVVSTIDFLGDAMSPKTPAPFIVPLGDGRIQLEWHRAGVDVELLVGDDPSEELYVYDIAKGSDWEGPALEGFIELDLARRLM